MQVGKTSKRLETEVQKLNNIINSLVEENYFLKSMLAQQTNTTQTTKQNK